MIIVNLYCTIIMKNKFINKNFLFLSLMFGLAGCNESSINTSTQSSSNTNNQINISKLDDDQLISTFKKLATQNNHKLLAVYDVGINGFKLLLTEQGRNVYDTRSVTGSEAGTINKTLVSDDGNIVMIDGFNINDKSNNSFAEQLSKTKFSEELTSKQRNDVVSKYVQNGVWLDKDNLHSFTITRGNGERKLMVMTDPDCPYCRKLEATLKDVDNVTITYLFFPIPSLHPDAERKANILWKSGANSEERYKNWIEFQNTGELPKIAENNSIQDYDFDYVKKAQSELGDMVVTPFMMNLRTHETLAGALPKEHLEAFLNANQEIANKPTHSYRQIYSFVNDK